MRWLINVVTLKGLEQPTPPEDSRSAKSESRLTARAAALGWRSLMPSPPPPAW